jgi:hypothetical protein
MVESTPTNKSFVLFIQRELHDIHGLLLSVVDKLPRSNHSVVCKSLKKIANALDRVEEEL